MRTLSESKARDVEAALTRAHKLIHKTYEAKKVTASVLTDLAKQLSDASRDLRELGASPFLAIDPTPPMTEKKLEEPDLRWR